jgi:hypothetical protein
LGLGFWVLGLGFGVLAQIPNPQSPIPNPQSPIPNADFDAFDFIIIFSNNKIKNKNGS